MADTDGPPGGPPAPHGAPQSGGADATPEPVALPEADQVQADSALSASIKASADTIPDPNEPVAHEAPDTAVTGDRNVEKQAGLAGSVGRGVVDLANNVSNTIYGVTRNAAQAAGLWRGAHQQFTTEAEVTKENPAQIDQQWSTRTFGAPGGTADRIVEGLTSVAPLLFVPGIGEETGATTASAKLAVAGTAIMHPGDTARSIAALPLVGPALSRVMTAAHMMPNENDPFVEAQAKDVLTQFLTNRATLAVLHGVQNVARAVRGAPAEEAVASTAKAPPTTVETHPNPAGGMDLHISTPGHEPPPGSLAESMLPGKPKDLRPLGEKLAEPNAIEDQSRTYEAPPNTGPAPKPPGTDWTGEERRGPTRNAFLTDEEAQQARIPTPPTVIHLPEANLTDAESLGSSIEEASRAHAAADAVETSGVELTEQHRAGITKLAAFLANDSNPERESVASIISGHGLTEVSPYLGGPGSAGKFVDTINETLDRAAGHFAQTGDQILATARDLMPTASPEQLSKFQQAVEDAPNWGKQAIGAKIALRLHWGTVERLAQAADAAPGNAVAQASLSSAFEFGMQLHNGIEAIASGFGRGLGTESPWGQALVERGAEETGPTEAGVQAVAPQMKVEDYMRAVRGLPKDAPIAAEDWSALVRQAAQSDGSPATLYKAIKQFQKVAQARALPQSASIPFGTRAWAAAAIKLIPEGLISNLISGVATLEHVAISGAFNNLTDAASKVAGSLPMLSPVQAAMGEADFVRGWNPGLMREGLNQAIYGFKHFGDAFTIAASSFRAGESRLAPGLGGTVNIPTPQGLGWLHTLLSAPGRLHMAEGEFNRAWGYLGEVSAKSIEDSIRAGKTGAELASRLESDQAFSVTPDGAMVNKDASDAVLRNTNVRALGTGSLAQYMTKWSNSSPFAKMIAPIIRIPSNVSRYIGETTPILGNFVKQNQADFARGGTRAATAQGRMELGTYAIGGMATLAYHGLVTGSGPTDGKAYSAWAETNHPYSIKIGNEWHSYAVLGGLGSTSKLGSEGGALLSPGSSISKMVDNQEHVESYSSHYVPHAYMLGRVADAVQAMAHMTGDAQIRLLSHITTGFAQAAQDQLWMRDAVNSMSALMNGDITGLQKWEHDRAQSMLVPGLVRSFNFDPVRREIDSVWDAVKAGIPGLSESLEPYRDGFGKPRMYAPNRAAEANHKLNIFSGYPAGNATIHQQLEELGKSVSLPHPVEYRQLDSFRVDYKDRDKFANDGTKPRQSPWDRIGELVNSEQIRGGRTLEEAITAKMAQPEWQRLAHTDGLFDTHSRAVNQIQTITSSYYDAAKRRVMQEYPALKKALYGARAVSGTARFGNEAAEDAAIHKLINQAGDK